MLQLYYNLGSPPSRAVLQTIRVLGLDVEVKHVDLFKQEHLLPDFVKLNPLHQVPLLVDGDVIIAESRAIQAYLVNSRQPGSDWYPSDPVARALVDQRLYFDATNFFENIISILRPYFFQGITDVPTEKKLKLKGTLNHLNSFLDGETYIAGSKPTIADIAVSANWIMLVHVFSNYGDYPNITAWFKRCESIVGFEESWAGGALIKGVLEAKALQPISLE